MTCGFCYCEHFRAQPTLAPPHIEDHELLIHRLSDPDSRLVREDVAVGEIRSRQERTA
jgi:hypothetical protein